MDTPLARQQVQDAVALLTLNRPDVRNALSVELRDEMSDELDRLASAGRVKVVIITGAGDSFSGGFDLTEFDRAQDDQDFERRLWASSDRFHHTLLRTPLVLIAAVNGPAVAGGFDLATMCDLRVVSNQAWFERPEVRFTTPIYGVLHDLVGGSVARDLTLTGRRVPAQEADQIGLATQLVEPAHLLDRATELATTVSQSSLEDLRRVRAKIVSRQALAGRATLDL